MDTLTTTPQWQIPETTQRKVILTFLKKMAGMKSNTPNYALADFYDEKNFPQIGKYVRNKT